MSESPKIHNSYCDGQIIPGSEIKINRSICLQSDKMDISDLIAFSPDTLKKMRDDSLNNEKLIFQKLCEAAEEWDKYALNTNLIDKAIEYMNTPTVEHTSNQWKQGMEDACEISNMVYKLSYFILKGMGIRLNRNRPAPEGWYLTWEICTNTALITKKGRIAGQCNLWFNDRTELEACLNELISAYAHLFKETSPPISPENKEYFCVNGQLLPGYRVNQNKIKYAENAFEERISKSHAYSKKKKRKRMSMVGIIAALKKIT